MGLLSLIIFPHTPPQMVLSLICKHDMLVEVNGETVTFCFFSAVMETAAAGVVWVWRGRSVRSVCPSPRQTGRSAWRNLLERTFCCSTQTKWWSLVLNLREEGSNFTCQSTGWMFVTSCDMMQILALPFDLHKELQRTGNAVTLTVMRFQSRQSSFKILHRHQRNRKVQFDHSLCFTFNRAFSALMTHTTNFLPLHWSVASLPPFSHTSLDLESSLWTWRLPLSPSLLFSPADLCFSMMKSGNYDLSLFRLVSLPVSTCWSWRNKAQCSVIK